MLELGKYAGTVLGAWGVTLGLVALLVAVSLRQANKSKRALAAAEARLAQKKAGESKHG